MGDVTGSSPVYIVAPIIDHQCFTDLPAGIPGRTLWCLLFFIRPHLQLHEVYFRSISKEKYVILILTLAITTSLCSHIFLVLRDHGVYMYVVYI